jgi:hypothetical protein
MECSYTETAAAIRLNSQSKGGRTYERGSIGVRVSFLHENGVRPKTDRFNKTVTVYDSGATIIIALTRCEP